MHDNNHTDEFEHYLQQQVTDHRMYPSDRVWKNVRGKIQPQKKWPALSVFTVLVISALVIGTLLNKPVPDTVTPNFAYSLQSPANNQSANSIKETNNKQQVGNSYSVNELTSRTITAAVEKILTDEAVSKQFYEANDEVNFDNNSVIAFQNTTINNIATAAQNAAVNSAKDERTLTGITASNKSPLTNFKNIDNYLFDVTSRLKNILNTEPVHIYGTGGVAFFTSGKKENYDDDNFEFKALTEHKSLLPSINDLGKTSSRFDFRFYVTPSVSYRRLEKKENTDVKNSGVSLESDYRVDPSKAINHTPALGYETGVGLGYKLNKKFSLTGGLQFNISRYKINAFLYKDETAAVTLDEGEFASTVNTVSSLRSVPGNDPLTIRNRYYQISVPLGAEYQIFNKGKFNWGVGASVQPTYTFDKQPLIISSNYKNYTDGSPYVRNWNLNVNAETFLGYTTGSYRWQVGPQLRYQMLPSLVDKYPNKEYLFNYGLKIGVVKQLK